VTGTSAEAGRGNRVNGLITPYRPMTMESVAGKNPVTHVGKVYNVTAQLMTQALVDAIDGVTDAQCCLVSQIGLPVNEPQLVGLQLRTAEAVALEEVRARAEAIVREHLGEMGALRERRLRRQPPLI
jgi:S-adenosylmethionine synthetase